MKRCILLLCFLLTTGLSFSQSTNATISGGVTDPSGNLITDAQVLIENDATGVVYSARTNQVGMYLVPILPPGHYHVQVSKQGFKTIIKADVTLSVQSAVALNFELPVGATSESLTVNAPAVEMNTTDASVSTVVDRKFVANLPLNGRSFQDLIAMTPGVVTQSPQSTTQTVGVGGDFSVNGQRTQSNYYTVDGVSANISAGNGGGAAGAGTAGVLPGGTALGTTQALISVDALEEFRVQSSTYSAEYGRSPGGQFSLVTRSGTNIVHGSAFDYLRNNYFDANDWFNDHYGKPTPALRQNDFGGTVSGPVLIPRLYNGKSRTFFFFSYEGLRLTQPIAATVQYVPDLSMRQQAVAAMQPILNAFPLPNGLDYGTSGAPSLAQFIAPYSSPSSIDATSIRLDHAVTPKVALFFRAGVTPSSTTSRPYFARTVTSANTQTYTLGASAQFSNALTSEARIGYARSDAAQIGVLDNFGGAVPTDLAADMGAGAFQQVLPLLGLSISGIGSATMTPYNAQNEARQWNVVDTFTALRGRQTLKFGLDYRHIKSPILPPQVEPYALFTSSQQMLSGAPSFPYVSVFLPATPIFHQAALFVNDTWKIRPSLTLSLGLRWELSPPPTEQHGNDAYTLFGSVANPSSLSLAPQGTPLWKTSWYNFAPRLGVAWTAHALQGKETIVRAGGGVFFDSADEVGSLGFSSFGFRAAKTQTGAVLPFTTAQLTIPISTSAPYTSSTIVAFPAHLQLPYTLQWNVSLEQALGEKQAITFSYVAAAGRRLLGVQQESLGKLNPNFGTVQYFAGGVTSNYQALQTEFQRSVGKGLQALIAYTWSHALDFGSNSTALPLQYGDSDFDVRHNLQAGVSWDIPVRSGSELRNALLQRWGADLRLNERTAFPVTLGGNLTVNAATGEQYYSGLNVMAGQPIYLYGSQYPGGKAINRAAVSVPPSGSSGNGPRNFVRGFAASQLNLAFRKDIVLFDPLVLHIRAETFNLLNHPNFGYVDAAYTDALFGQATKMLNASLGTVASQYQQGGPRSMQFALKLTF